MSQSRYEQLLLTRNATLTTWESHLDPNITLQDLDEKEIKNIVKDIIKNKRVKNIINPDDVPEILTRLKLMRNGLLTRAAFVLFAKEISGDYMQCIIRMARFRGLEKKISLTAIIYLVTHSNSFMRL